MLFFVGPADYSCTCCFLVKGVESKCYTTNTEGNPTHDTACQHDGQYTFIMSKGGENVLAVETQKTTMTSFPL